MKWNWKEWLKYALLRAVKTFAQSFAACIGVGAALEEIQWLRALSVSTVAFVLSLATSLGGIPEVPNKPETQPPEDPEDTLPE